mgnify:FL=1
MLQNDDTIIIVRCTHSHVDTEVDEFNLSQLNISSSFQPSRVEIAFYIHIGDI